jgi:hypothetical protein
VVGGGLAVAVGAGLNVAVTDAAGAGDPPGGTLPVSAGAAGFAAAGAPGLAAAGGGGAPGGGGCGAAGDCARDVSASASEDRQIISDVFMVEALIGEWLD